MARRASAGASLVLLIVMTAGELSASNPPKICASYFYDNSGETHVQQLKASGFNTMLIKSGGDVMEKLGFWAELAEKHGMHYYPVVNWAGKPELKNLADTSRRYTQSDGTVARNTPCPLDCDYWRKVVQERAILVAERAKEVKITGFLVDPEMYGADILFYSSDGCFCDECFAGFFHGETVPNLPPAERRAFLVETGRMDAYREYQEREVWKISRMIERHVHRINPDLKLGFLNYSPTPFLRGWARGFGTLEHPVSVWSETTYLEGYSSYVDHQIQEFKKERIYADFVPGLWLTKFTPDDLAIHAYHCALHSPGYWIYTTYSISDEASRAKDASVPSTPAEEYWKWLKRGNGEIERLDADPGYVSPLKLKPRASILPPVPLEGPKVPSLRPLQSDVGLPSASDRLPPRLRDRFTMYLYLTEGVEVSCKVGNIRLGKYIEATAYALFAGDGAEVLRGKAEVGASSVFTVRPEKTGVYALVVNSGLNAARVSVSGAPYVYELPVHPMYDPCRLYFAVPGDAGDFRLSVRTPGGVERCKLKVMDARGGAVVERIVDGNETFELNRGSQDGCGVWSVDIMQPEQGMLEDVDEVQLYGVPAYVSDRPDSLLIPTGDDERRKEMPESHVSFGLDMTCLFASDATGRLLQMARLAVDNGGDAGPGKLELQLPGGPVVVDLGTVPSGASHHQIPLPPVSEAVDAQATLRIGGRNVYGAARLEPRRRWTVFLVHHTHTDIGYTDLQSRLYEEHARIIDTALDFCSQTDDYPEGSKFKWVNEVSWAVKNYLERRPERMGELVRRMKEGRIETTALYVNMTELYTYEELLRSLYFADRLRHEFGVPITSAMNSDISGLSWAVPQILNSFGVKYLSMATNEIRARAPQVPRPFWWESPDGSRVMVLNADHEIYSYSEGYELGFGRTYEEVLEKLPTYLDRLVSRGYPHDTTCFRMAGDNVPPHLSVSQIARRWNETWAYPKVRVATSTEFFEHMEREAGERLPVYSLGWPDWWADGNASAAFETGLSRKTHVELDVAEKLAALAGTGSRAPGEVKARIDKAHENSMLFDEHTWGAPGSVDRPHSVMTKAQWAAKSAFVYDAAIAASGLVRAGLRDLAARVPSEGREVVVFNPLSWTRTDVVDVDVTDLVEPEAPGVAVRDVSTGKAVPAQLVANAGVDRRVVRVLCRDVPPLGYKMLAIRKSKSPAVSTSCGSLRNRFYEISFGDSGWPSSIRDLDLGVELLDQSSRYALGQCIYEEIVSPERRWAIWEWNAGRRRGAKFRRTTARVIRTHPGASGPVYDSIIIESRTKRCPLIRQELIVYRGIKRIDLVTRLAKEETFDPEALYIAFPFAIARPVVRYEDAGAVMQPEAGQLPGTAKDWYSVQTWVDMSESRFGVTWSPVEAPLVQFGGITTGRWLDKLTIRKGLLLSWPMNNYWFTNFRASQGGEFEFHYSLTSHSQDWSNAESSRFGWGFNSPLHAVAIGGKREGDLPGDAFSFGQVKPDNVLISAVKPAEHSNGLAIRLREVNGTAAHVTLRLAVPVNRAVLADGCERELHPLEVDGDSVEFDLPPFGLATIVVS